MTTVEAKGDCYEVALNHIVYESTDEDGLVLVHGVVTGQGPLEGMVYGHAWIEDGDWVIDRSNGNDVTIPRAIYYAIGNITDTRRYDRQEAIGRCLEVGHYGAWDIDGTPRPVG